MGKNKGSHRDDGGLKKKKQQETGSKRTRRYEGPEPTGRHIAQRNATRFIQQQSRKRNTGQGDADHKRKR